LLLEFKFRGKVLLRRLERGVFLSGDSGLKNLLLEFIIIDCRTVTIKNELD